MPSMLTTPPEGGRVTSNFLLRLAVLLLLTAAVIGVPTYFLYSQSIHWTDLAPSVSAIICGIFAGLFSRLIYRGWPRFIRWIFACIASCAALAVAGLIGYQYFNIDLSGITTAAVQPDFSILSVMAAASAFLVVFAWRKKTVMVQPKNELLEAAPTNFPIEDCSMPVFAAEPVAPPRSRSPRKTRVSLIPDGLRRQFRKNNWRRLKRKWTDQWVNLFRFGKKILKNPFQSFFHQGTQPGRHISPRKSVNRLQIRVPEHRAAPPASLPVALPRKHPGRRTHHPVRLIGREELRCPYCLQLIEPHERRRMVVCPICHAAHHKECWEITGSCQVPHNHAVL